MPERTLARDLECGQGQDRLRSDGACPPVQVRDQFSGQLEPMGHRLKIRQFVRDVGLNGKA